MTVSVDKTGYDQTVGGKGTRVEIACAGAHVRKLSGLGDRTVTYDERIIVERFAVHERPRAAHEFTDRHR